MKADTLNENRELICFILVYLFYLFSNKNRTWQKVGAQIFVKRTVPFINNETE